jgi:hypothetical protein
VSSIIALLERSRLQRLLRQGLGLGDGISRRYAACAGKPAGAIGARHGRERFSANSESLRPLRIKASVNPGRAGRFAPSSRIWTAKSAQLHLPCEDLSVQRIEKANLAKTRRRRLRGATVPRDLAALSCLCSCAVEWDYLDTNPVKRFSKRNIRESAPRTTRTAEQIDRLVTYASTMAGRTIRFPAETGMPQEEICGNALWPGGRLWRRFWRKSCIADRHHAKKTNGAVMCRGVVRHRHLTHRWWEEAIGSLPVDDRWIG